MTSVKDMLCSELCLRTKANAALALPADSAHAFLESL